MSSKKPHVRMTQLEAIRVSVRHHKETIRKYWCSCAECPYVSCRDQTLSKLISRLLKDETHAAENPLRAIHCITATQDTETVPTSAPLTPVY